jgi:RNA polymerase sigma-70 factor (ECF subfamily)
MARERKNVSAEVSPPTPTSGDWARKLRLGEPDAVHVVRHRIRKILSYRGLHIPAAEQEDLEQEIMTEVWQAVNRQAFDFTAGFWGFIEVVSSRRCIDWLRRQRKHAVPRSTLVDPRSGPSEALLDQERSDLAIRVIRTLDPACRDLVAMRFHDGLSYDEIGVRVGKSPGAVRVQMHRCIQRARELMAELSDE